ncbi:RNase P subunit p30 family protein [Halococcoides cellulosivorans]|uniref:Ribonuclease P protein component 3 n=1 Tax=Halococcoides cellulosivorans TaxID=1679096 RepID=A0A2R4X3A6_9EURY|nr:RNase P subunit p30 family protein [Halococcoides cellulosivorans]AWB28272.1 ribonuclease P [Halococcoides cellulosivorans]
MSYAAVLAHPEGSSTVARFALTASECGYDGIVVRNHGGSLPEYDPAAIAAEYDIDVVSGVEVRADDPSRASGFVGNHRADKTIVAVHGDDPEINRFAVEHPAVDVLAHPMADDGDLNHVLAKAARENGVRLEIDLGPLVRERAGDRVRALQGLRKLQELRAAYDVPAVVSLTPTSHLHLRAPREVVALGESAGFDAATIRAGLAEWGHLAARNRERRDEAFVEPGVRRIDGPGDGTGDGT